MGVIIVAVLVLALAAKLTGQKAPDSRIEGVVVKVIDIPAADYRVGQTLARTCAEPRRARRLKRIGRRNDTSTA